MYLKERPRGESFLAFDRICEAIAFLTGRTSPVDYSLKYYENSRLSEQDLSGVERVADEHKIETIIIGTNFLPDSQAEQSLFDYLKRNYTLVLDNSTHLIYQRIAE